MSLKHQVVLGCCLFGHGTVEIGPIPNGRHEKGTTPTGVVFQCLGVHMRGVLFWKNSCTNQGEPAENLEAT